jgi:hypothetical protein
MRSTTFDMKLRLEIGHYEFMVPGSSEIFVRQDITIHNGQFMALY